MLGPLENMKIYNKNGKKSLFLRLLEIFKERHFKATTLFVFFNSLSGARSRFLSDKKEKAEKRGLIIFFSRFQKKKKKTIQRQFLLFFLFSSYRFIQLRKMIISGNGFRE